MSTEQSAELWPLGAPTGLTGAPLLFRASVLARIFAASPALFADVCKHGARQQRRLRGRLQQRAHSLRNCYVCAKPSLGRRAFTCTCSHVGRKNTGLCVSITSSATPPATTGSRCPTTDVAFHTLCVDSGVGSSILPNSGITALVQATISGPSGREKRSTNCSALGSGRRATNRDPLRNCAVVL